MPSKEEVSSDASRAVARPRSTDPRGNTIASATNGKPPRCRCPEATCPNSSVHQPWGTPSRRGQGLRAQEQSIPSENYRPIPKGYEAAYLLPPSLPQVQSLRTQPPPVSRP